MIVILTVLNILYLAAGLGISSHVMNAKGQLHFSGGLGSRVVRKDSLAIHLEAKRTGRRLSEVRVGREVVPDEGRKQELSEIGNRLQRYVPVASGGHGSVGLYSKSKSAGWTL